jgi:carbon storage regulator
MLVLSRKIGECVVIADDIVVKVLDVQGGRIRLGIEAPPYVSVWREELSVPAEPASALQAAVRKPR